MLDVQLSRAALQVLPGRRQTLAKDRKKFRSRTGHSGFHGYRPVRETLRLGEISAQEKGGQPTLPSES
jgi:hypothetical protein